MGWEAWVALATIVVLMWSLVREWASPDVVLLGVFTWFMTLSLVSDRFLSPAAGAAVFGNEGLLTVGALFVVAAGLTRTDGLSILTSRFLDHPHSLASAQARVMVPVAAASSVLNNTPVVAMFMPLVSDLARRSGISPSKLFIPLSYAAVLGGICTLIGTSTNLVVQGLLIEARRADPALPLFGFFTLSVIGIPAALLGIGYILVSSRWTLPARRSSEPLAGDPRRYTIELEVEPGGPVDGRTIEEAGLRHLAGVFLASVERDAEVALAVAPTHRLRGRDRLVFVGAVDSIVDLQRIRGLAPGTDQVLKLSLPRHSRGLVEAVVSASSSLVGQNIRDARFRSRYGAVVLAVHRAGERLDQKIGDIVLRAGDALLLEAPPSFLDTWRNATEFFVSSPVHDSRPRNRERGWIAVAVLAGFVTAAALDLVSELNGALLAAALMGLTGCLTAADARRSIDWGTLVSIGAALGIGRTVETTGLAQAAAATMIPFFGNFGDLGLLAGVYLLVLLFTEVLTNNAAAALVFPIAHAVAESAGLNLLPFAVAIAIGASAGFATPLGYQTHLMVYGPGGYRFSDYVRIGVPLDLLVMAVTVALTPIFFPLR